MIKMDLVLLYLLISFNCSFSTTQKGEGTNGDLTNTSKCLIDCFLKEKDNQYLDSTESVVLMTFENNKKNKTLVINDTNKEPYADLKGCIYTHYRNFLIIVDGIPDDFFFKAEDIDKKRLKKNLKKEKKENQKMYKMIEKGKYKGDIPIYSEYDPFVYYYITYNNGQITESTPSYLKERINK